MIRLSVPLLPRTVRWGAACLAATAIFSFSILTAPPGRPPEPGPLWDKKLHFVAYAGLTLSLIYATSDWQARPWMRIGLIWGCILIFGFGIELLQGLLPARYFGFDDFLANCIGMLLASLWFWIESRADIEYLAVTDLF